MQHLQTVFGPNGWRSGNCHLFKSDAALQWWLRPPERRRELIEAGALFMLGGKLMVDPVQMTQAVLAIAKRDALAAVGARDVLSVDRRVAA